MELRQLDLRDTRSVELTDPGRALLSEARNTLSPRKTRTAARRRRGATWTADQLTAWLKIATLDRDSAMWVLAATAGMGRSESAGFEQGLLDLDRAMLEVADTRVVVDGKAEESDGKTEAGRGDNISGRAGLIDSWTRQAYRGSAFTTSDTPTQRCPSTPE